MKTRSLIVSLLAVLALPALAQVTVSNAWVRGTVPQQQASGAFMTLQAAKATRLVGASSPVAAVVEIHEMKMDGDKMMMRAVPGLDLPAGKPVELKAGGYHVMLMGLKQQLKEGENVTLTLQLQGADGKKEQLNVTAPVRPLAAAVGHNHNH